MPLIMAEIGKKYTIKVITGDLETKHRLEKMGFVAGAPIELVSRQNGNIIVRVMESRIAIGSGLASKILL